MLEALLIIGRPVTPFIKLLLINSSSTQPSSFLLCHPIAKLFIKKFDFGEGSTPLPLLNRNLAT